METAKYNRSEKKVKRSYRRKETQEMVNSRKGLEIGIYYGLSALVIIILIILIRQIVITA